MSTKKGKKGPRQPVAKSRPKDRPMAPASVPTNTPASSAKPTELPESSPASETAPTAARDTSAIPAEPAAAAAPSPSSVADPLVALDAIVADVRASEAAPVADSGDPEQHAFTIPPGTARVDAPAFTMPGGSDSLSTEGKPGRMEDISGEPKRKGGWPKGKPRKPRADGVTTERPAWVPGADAPAVAPTDVRGVLRLQRENDALRSQLNDANARLNVQTHGLVKSAIQGVTLMAGKMLARQHGDHMLVTNEEAKDVGEHVGNALIPFLGDMSKYAPWVAAVGSIAAIAIPRAEIEDEIRRGLRPRVKSGAIAPPMPTPAAEPAGATE